MLKSAITRRRPDGNRPVEPSPECGSDGVLDRFVSIADAWIMRYGPVFATESAASS
jgi:hypothetical protein